MFWYHQNTSPSATERQNWQNRQISSIENRRNEATVGTLRWLLFTGTFFYDFGIIMILQVLYFAIFTCEWYYHSFNYFLIKKHVYSSRVMLRRLQANKTFVCAYKILRFCANPQKFETTKKSHLILPHGIDVPRILIAKLTEQFQVKKIDGLELATSVLRTIAVFIAATTILLLNSPKQMQTGALAAAHSRPLSEWFQSHVDWDPNLLQYINLVMHECYLQPPHMSCT